MRASDVVGFCAVVSFGLWWILFPISVLRFYTWFHRGKARLPGPRGVRLAGVFWVVVVAVVFWASRGQWSSH
jgi:hypothetical protein